MCEQASDAAVGYCDPIGLSPQLPHTIDPRSQRLCVDSCGGHAGNGRKMSKQEITQPPSRFRTVVGLIRSLGLALAFKNVAQNLMVYPVHVSTRKSFGLMTRKLSVTESRKRFQFLGTLSRKKSSVASANCPHVA